MLRRRSHGSLSLAVRLTIVGGLVAVIGALAATTVSAGLLPGLNLPLNVTVPGVIHVGPAPASKAASNGAGLNLNLGGLALGLLPTPSGLSLPSPSVLPTLPTLPPTPTPTLPPVTGCTTSCPPTNSPGGTPTGQPTTTALPGGVGGSTGGGGGGGSGNVSAFPLAVTPSHTGAGGSAALIPGLHDTPPLPVQTLSAVPGISFGQAPYLWPLFLLLDLVAAAAVVLVVRKTWSRSTST